MTKNQKIGAIAVIIIILLVIIGYFAYQNKQTQEMIKQVTGIAIKESNNNSSGTSETSKTTPTPISDNNINDDNVAKDPQNTTYTIEGEKVTLINGKSADGKTTMFGEPTIGDLNGDSANDAGVILVVSGGSGTFYYASTALNNTKTYTYDGTNSIILGDRISPQTKDIQNEIYTVNYADRPQGAPMTEQPSVGVSKYFKINGTTLVETDKNQ